jgi:signal peptidase I
MLRFLAWVVGILGVVGLGLYAFVFDVWVVPGDDPQLTASVAPTLSPGDVVLLLRRPGLDHGYLTRCPDPQAPGRFVVARAIARGGETVDFAGEIVSVDGHHTPSARRCETGDVVVHDPTSDSDLLLACEVEEYGEVDFSVLRSFTSPKSAPPRHTVDPARWFLVSDDRHVHLDSRDYGEVDPQACQHVLFRLAQSGRPSLGVLW